MDLDASQQGEVRKDDRAQVTLPGNTAVTGRVAGFGRVAQADQGSQAAAATIPTFSDLDPGNAAGLDQAPVAVDITTKGVDDALSVPITALVGRSGGGFAVEVVRGGGRRALVAVQPPGFRALGSTASRRPPRTRIVTDGFSCRSRIEHGSDRRPRQLAQVARAALDQHPWRERWSRA